MKTQSIDGKMAWAIVCYNASQKGLFYCVTGIEYQLRLEGNMLFYKGGNRNNGEEEPILKDEFITAFERIKALDEINTSTIKTLIPNSLYRKRTPFVGLLYSFGIIQ
jgi:hypothetical protein